MALDLRRAVGPELTAGQLEKVVVVAGALITAGALYTGKRLEGVLGDAVQQGNQQIQAAFVGHEGSASLAFRHDDIMAPMPAAWTVSELQRLQSRRPRRAIL